MSSQFDYKMNVNSSKVGKSSGKKKKGSKSSAAAAASHDAASGTKTSHKNKKTSK